ncbi:MAG: alcohol dehydrogenase catalytic domain-containing protein [Methanomassiliicoccales archaeon]|nr:alcohol dehydrogenase catalytic domain-containing protein [Methanomassiliicoccales archaeon]
MKAVVLRGVNDLRLEELPDPEPTDKEVLIRIRAVGICGTDVDMWEGTNKEGTFPFIPGHEWVGDVIKVGRKIKSLSVGDRVVGECFLPCHICPNCKDGMSPAMCINPKYYGFAWETPGGMAEYHVSEEERLHKIPDTLTYEEAALVEPISVAYHGIWGVGGGVAPHDRVVIFGCGPIGLCALLICKVAGAFTVAVEPQPFRRKLAKDLGADVVVDPSEEKFVMEIMDCTKNRGATLVLECSGSDVALAASVEVVAKEGRIVLIGHSVGRKVPIEIGKSIWQGAKIFGSCDSPFFIPKTLDFMARKLADFTKIITYRFPLAQALTAFETARDNPEAVKILLIP